MHILSYYPSYTLESVKTLTVDQINLLIAGLVWRGVLKLEKPGISPKWESIRRMITEDAEKRDGSR